MSLFDTFAKKHEYLVCVDSDGCVMDTMNCKHFHCFGPCMVEQWHLEPWQDAILHRWNEINLFSMTRGINRFKGLAMALQEIDTQYKKIPGIEALVHWANTAPALSNDAIAKAIEEATDGEAKQILTQALAWSKAVNAAIVALDEALKVPYAGAAEGLAVGQVVFRRLRYVAGQQLLVQFLHPHHLLCVGIGGQAALLLHYIESRRKVQWVFRKQ
jgi:hypothetical protein